MDRRTRVSKAIQDRFHFVPDITGHSSSKLVYLGDILLGSLEHRKTPDGEAKFAATLPGSTSGWLDFDTLKEALGYLVDSYKPNGTAQYSVNW